MVNHQRIKKKNDGGMRTKKVKVSRFNYVAHAKPHQKHNTHTQAMQFIWGGQKSYTRPIKLK